MGKPKKAEVNYLFTEKKDTWWLNYSFADMKREMEEEREKSKKDRMRIDAKDRIAKLERDRDRVCEDLKRLDRVITAWKDIEAKLN